MAGVFYKRGEKIGKRNHCIIWDDDGDVLCIKYYVLWKQNLISNYKCQMSNQIQNAALRAVNPNDKYNP